MPEVTAQHERLILSRSLSADGTSGDWQFDARSLQQLDPKLGPYDALTVLLPNDYLNAFVSLGAFHATYDDVSADLAEYLKEPTAEVRGSHVLDANGFLQNIYSKLVSQFDLVSASEVFGKRPENDDVGQGGYFNYILPHLKAAYIQRANAMSLAGSLHISPFQGLGRALYTTWGAVPCVIGSPSLAAPSNFLAEHYASRDWQRVASFLAANTFLSSVLAEALPPIEKHFGRRTKVILEVVEEPEAPGQEELFGFVETKMEPEEALRVLDAFDQDWWLDRAKLAKNRLNFALRFL